MVLVLPLVLSAVAALAVAPRLRPGLVDGGRTVTNYRGADLLAGITAYGEFRSISAFVERTPGFRHLDSVGRIHHPRKDAPA